MYISAVPRRLLPTILSLLLLSCASSYRTALRSGEQAYQERRWNDVVTAYNPHAERIRKPEPHFQLGYARLQLERYVLAQQAFVRHVQLGGDRGRAYRFHGECNYLLQRDNEAYADFQRALEHGYEDAYMHRLMGIITRRRRNDAASLSHFQQAVLLDSSDASAHLDLGFAKFKLNEYASTIADFERALRHGTDSPAFCWNNMAYAWCMLDSLDRAGTCVEKALALNPRSQATWKNVGLIKLKRGDTMGACDALAKAASLPYPNTNKAEREDTEALIRALLIEHCGGRSEVEAE
jgi:tetratricopeptide (TPR) repeat protein